MMASWWLFLLLASQALAAGEYGPQIWDDDFQDTDQAGWLQFAEQFKTCPHSINYCSQTSAWSSTSRYLWCGTTASNTQSGKGYGIEARGHLISYVSADGQATRQSYKGSNTIYALGLSDNSIHSSQLAQVGGRSGRTAINVRLDDAKALPWSPNAVGGASYITVNLGFPYKIYTIGTQGDSFANNWLTGYRVDYLPKTGTAWITNAQTFTGVNTNSNTTVYKTLTTPIIARQVRIVPTAIQGNGAFRFELYGHPEDRTAGIATFHIPASAFSAQGGTNPHNARLGLPIDGWYGTGTASYLTIDLGRVYTVTGLAIQGRHNAHHYVTQFNVATGLTTSDFSGTATFTTGFTSSNHRIPLKINFQSAVQARYVRINPRAGTSTWGVRVEVFGTMKLPLTGELPQDVLDSQAWTDYRFQVSFRNLDIMSAGFMFRYQDPWNFYGFLAKRGSPAAYSWGTIAPTVSASNPGFESGRNTPAMITDTNVATYIATRAGQSAQWIQVDLRVNVQIKTLTMVLGPHALSNARVQIIIYPNTRLHTCQLTPPTDYINLAARATATLNCAGHTARYVRITQFFGQGVVSLATLTVNINAIPTQYTLYKRVNGVFTQLDTTTSAVSLTAYTTHTVEVKGSSIQLFRGTSTTALLTATDSSLDRGTVGAYYGDAYRAYWDNFVVSPWVEIITLNTATSHAVKAGTWVFFKVAVGSSADALQVLTEVTSAGNGGLQVYLQKSKPPTLTEYLERVLETNYALRYTTAILPFPTANSNYYIGVFAASASPAAVTFSITTSTLQATLLNFNTQLTGQTVGRRQWKFYKIAMDVDYKSVTTNFTVTSTVNANREPLRLLMAFNTPPTVTEGQYNRDYAQSPARVYSGFLSYPTTGNMYYYGVFGADETLGSSTFNVFAMPAPPAIQTMSPVTSPTQGGLVITLSGEETFGRPGSVTINGLNCVVSTWRSNQVLCSTPAGEGVSRDLKLTTNLGQVSNVLPFSYLPPTLATISPSTGPTAGSTSIALTGTNFGVNPVVTFGSSTATITSKGHSSLVFSLPVGSGTDMSVLVTVAGQVSNVLSFSYLAPVVSGFTPANGPTSGGTKLTISGANFGTGSVTRSVRVGSANCPIEAGGSHTQIVCTVQAGERANLVVEVTVNGQSGVASTRFAYIAPAITGISPSIGLTDGGNEVTITGTNFGLTPIAEINGRTCVKKSSSHVQFVCTTPAGDGATNPTVISVGGQSSPAFNFRRTGPTVTGISPSNTLTSGGSITISGMNFGLIPTVTVATIDCPVVSSTHSQIICNAAAGQGTQRSVIVNANNQFSPANAAAVVNYFPPQIGTINPSLTDTSGNIQLTINGANFGTDGTIVVGSSNCPKFSWSHTQVRCTLAPGQGRNNKVRMTVSSQVSNEVDLHFNPPSITGISPSAISTQGGDLVTLTGRNFGLATAGGVVTVGGKPCPYVADAYTHVQVVCTSAASTATDTTPVSVSVAGQTSNAVTYGFSSPTISSLSPRSGPTAGSVTLTLRGSSFDTSGSIRIGTYACPHTFWSHTEVRCTLPAGYGVSHAVVITTVAAKTSNAETFSYNPPSIGSISPTSAPTAPGTLLTIRGNNFGPSAGSGAGSVSVSGHACSVGGTGTSWTHTQVVCALPIGSGNAQQVTVTVGTLTSNYVVLSRLAPVLDAVNPSNGVTAGGYRMTLTGSNFVGPVDKPTTVDVGGVDCPIVSITDNEAICTVPASTNGDKVVRVTLDFQISSSRSFVFDRPEIDQVIPSNGPTVGGIPVMLVGRSFGPSATVAVNGINCPITEFHPHYNLTFTLPVGMGQGNQIQVTSSAISVSLPALFDYDGPVITSTDPVSLVSSGGLLTLIGTNFGSANSITIGGIDCPSAGAGINAEHTTSVCNVPAGAGWNLPVIMTVGGLQSPRFGFSYQIPMVTSVFPVNGPTPGGLVLTVKGSSFGSGGTVTVGGIACPIADFFYTHTEIRCTLPPGSGLENAVVVTRAGNSSTSDVSNANRFNYDGPTIDYINPLNGPTSGGYVLTVVGSNFGSNGDVFLNGRLCEPTGFGYTSSRIECSVPGGQNNVDGRVEVLISIGGQEARTEDFVYNGPSISSWSPTNSSTPGGGVLTMYGSNFGVEPVVTIGGSVCTLLASTHDDLTCTIPPGAGSPDLKITVGQPSATVTFEFFGPSVYAVSGCQTHPYNANATRDCPPQGEVLITVVGDNFGDAGVPVVVTVANNPCQSVTHVAASPHTMLTCMLPAGVQRDLPVQVFVGGKSASKGLVSYSGPEIYTNSLVYVSGTTAPEFNSSNSEYKSLLLPTIEPDMIVRLDGTNFGTNVQMVAVTYGPPGNPSVYNCTVVTVVASSITCRLSSGTGRDLVFQVAVKINIGYLATQTSLESLDSVTYPRPEIISQTLHRSEDASASNRLVGLYSDGELVRFATHNAFYGYDASNLRVTYGLYGGPYDQECSPVTIVDSPGLTNPVEPGPYVQCRMSKGDGGPYYFQVNATNYLSAEPEENDDRYQYPTPPGLYRIEGCPGQAGNATFDCPTRGGTRLTIHGENFVDGTGISIRIGVNECTNLVYFNDTYVTCLTPAQVGLNQIVSVRVGQLFSSELPLVSYAYAYLDEVRGCTNVANNTVDCPRAGGTTVTIMGRDLGGSGAIVLIGDSECQNVRHHPTDPHSRVSCELTPGTGLAKTILFIQGGGEIASNRRSVSYLQCPVGYFAPSEVITCSACPAGSFSDFIGLTACKQCEPGAFNPNQASSSCTGCSSGRFSERNGTLGATVCTSCAAGRYNAAVNQPSCIFCPEGSFLNRTQGTACVSCPEGRFAASSGSTVCLDCPEGSFASTSGSNLCPLCPAGRYTQRTGSQSCELCPEGTANSVPGQTCAPCPKGTAVSSTGQATCLNCGVGRFANATGMLECLPCSEGFFASRSGRSSCDRCASGEYMGLRGQAVCLLCSKGTYQPQIGSTECHKCQPGSLSALAGALACTNCTRGFYSSGEGSHECLPCPIGSFSSGAGISSCALCTSGQYQGSIASTRCLECPAGMAIDSQGQAVCAACRLGSFTNTSGKATCTQCPIGTYSDVSGTTCINCPRGTFTVATGQFECQPCPVGFFQDHEAQSSCSECAIGKAASRAMSTTCTNCTAGHFAPVAGSISCKPCEAGSYGPGVGLSTCTQCIKSTANPLAGASRCLDCVAGKFTSSDSQPLCVDCPAGSFTNSSASTACVLCDAGSYASAGGMTACTECLPGFYLPTEGQGTCLSAPLGRYAPTSGLHDAILCRRGTYAEAPQSIECKVCLAGTFASAEGLSYCLPCPGGTYNTLNTSSACESCAAGQVQVYSGQTFCNDCPAGSYIGLPGQQSCIQCPVGRFSSRPGSTVCSDCQVGSFTDLGGSTACFNCSSGYFTGADGTVTCSQCAEGFISPDEGAISCLACGPGQFQGFGNYSQCAACPPGFANPIAQQTSCRSCRPGFFSNITAVNDCTACPLGKYSEYSAASTRCLDCQAGRFTNVPGQLTCSPCDVGLYGNETGLSSCAYCWPGTFTSVAGSTVCSDCPQGYRSGMAALSCAACQAGRFALPDGSGCEVCPSGSYQAIAGQTDCVVCPAGTYTRDPGQVVCLDCPTGMFGASANQSSCAACAAGRYSSLPARTECQQCAPGSAMGTEGQPVCVQCDAGFFAPTAGMSECLACEVGKVSQKVNISGALLGATSCTNCGVGKWVSQSGQASCLECGVGMYGTGQQPCAPCSGGMNNSLVGQSECQFCEPGYYSSEHNNTNGAIFCDPCALGRFTGDFKTTECHNCPFGEYQDEAGASACKQCDVGYFTDNQRSFACKLCPPGEFSNETGSPNCMLCESGWYQNQYAQSTCLQCPYGKSVEADGADYCIDCPEGRYADVNGSTICIPCNEGSFQPQEGQDSCILCPEGFYNEGSGQKECKRCDPGQYSNDTGMSACLRCERGYYQAQYAQSSCEMCGHGTISVAEGMDLCELCAPGRYNDELGKSTCKACIVGEYQNVYGQASCKPCEKGQFSRDPEQATCKECEPGKFSNTTGAFDCILCPRATHQAQTGGQNCSACEPGKFNNAEGMEQCEPCEHGTYQDSPGQMSCLECQVGKAQSVPGRSACDDCEMGFFSSSTKLIECAGCDTGRFNNDTGLSQCFDCGPGTFQSLTAQSYCADCEPGRAVNLYRKAECDACEGGSFTSFNGSVECDQCSRGKYQAQTGQSECTLCEAGKFITESGALSCASCPSGRYSNVTGSHECLPCEEGKSQNQAGQTSCVPCPPGSFQGGTGQKECESCGPGTYNNIDGQVVCAACPVGTYQLNFNRTVCDDCEPGTANANTGLNVTCPSCSAGEYNTEYGRETCLKCQTGRYNNGRQGFLTCAPCSARTYASSTGLTFCELCEPGTFGNTTALARCFDCPGGFYQSANGQSVCSICEAGKHSESFTGSSTCLECMEGKYADQDGMALCTNCEAGKYQGFKNQRFCIDCPPGVRSSAGEAACSECQPQAVAPFNATSQCIVCPLESTPNDGPYKTLCRCPVSHASKMVEKTTPVNETDEFESPYEFQCWRCPQGARCDAVGIEWDKMETLPGWWESQGLYYRCLLESHCLGGRNSDCGDNRDGPICASCRLGYTETVGGGCSKCPSKGASWAFMLGIALIVILVFWFNLYIVLRSGGDYIEAARDVEHKKIDRLMGGIDEGRMLATSNQTRHNLPMLSVHGPPPPKSNFLYKLKILLSFVQIVTNLTIGLEVQFPATFKSFMAYFNPANFDFIQVSNVGCVYDSDYYDKLLVFCCVPIVAIVAILSIYFIPLSLKHRQDRTELKMIRKKSWKILLYILFLIYPTCSSAVLRTFVCKEITGTNYLLADFTVHCYDARWNSYAVFAAAMILVYPIGIPAFFFIMVFRYRKRLREPGTRGQLGFLYDAYHHKTYWFELVDMLHKLFVTCLVAFLPYDFQMPTAMCVVAMYTMLILVVKPYIRQGDDRLHLLAQNEIITLLIAGHVLNQYYYIDYTADLAMSVILIMIIMGFLAFFLMQAALFIRVQWKAYKERRRMRRKRGPGFHVRSKSGQISFGDLVPETDSNGNGDSEPKESNDGQDVEGAGSEGVDDGFGDEGGEVEMESMPPILLSAANAGSEPQLESEADAAAEGVPESSGQTKDEEAEAPAAHEMDALAEALNTQPVEI